jgi:hypothetical protein
MSDMTLFHFAWISMSFQLLLNGAFSLFIFTKELTRVIGGIQHGLNFKIWE